MIITILGLAGKDNKGNISYAYYDCSLLKKESKEYLNSTDFLLQNFDDNFYLIGTEKAIDLQKEILDFNGKNVNFIEIEDNSVDDIFEEVFKLISMSNDKVLLDITHGFRHQQIPAIFSATLYKFLNNGQLDIIFAKQIIVYKKYEYIYLNDYIDLTQLSLLLTGFIRTLNFVNSVEVDGLNTLAFVNFSKALLSNDFKTLISSYKNLFSTIDSAKKNPKFNHLKSLFEEIENILKDFKNFENSKLHSQYLILSKLMIDKNYYLLSLTYLFEAIRLYVSESFYNNGLIAKSYWEKVDRYKINQDILSFVSQEIQTNYKEGFYDNRFPNLYKKNRGIFNEITEDYDSLRKLRNDLTHINPNKSQVDIKRSLETLYDKIEQVIKSDKLKVINR